ncbi:WXG100 family type VII secretion target [Kitasatospora sp. A2-31]|uniref:WXG100 family type VII secretion target n=1 Tax=Kitasatospora sp. A2-31 TaxID=2916414 RepID=UPI001EE8627C|nr:WXG100 family type VII secretion target [Kitasatospora sp. A2-31]MCG6493671.1 WXG100 family type VII secretion target [Kitasatospora sp. A2-31]
MGQFKTTAQEMMAFAKHMDEVINTIDGEIKGLNTLVDSVKGGWQGQAAQAYTNLQREFNEDAVKLNQSLKAIKDAIEITTKQYSATDADQQAAFKA